MTSRDEPQSSTRTPGDGHGPIFGIVRPLRELAGVAEIKVRARRRGVEGEERQEPEQILRYEDRVSVEFEVPLLRRHGREHGLEEDGEPEGAPSVASSLCRASLSLPERQTRPRVLTSLRANLSKLLRIAVTSTFVSLTTFATGW